MVIVRLDGGLVLRLLSPDRKKLEDLVPRWEKECRAAGLIPGKKARRQPHGLERFGRIDIEALAKLPFVADRTTPNGSSIAALAEYDGRRVLLGADAHPDRLIASLRPLAMAEGGRLRLSAMKMPHHGSEHNVSPDLLNLISCDRYLISTNGSYFSHPNPTAGARIIKFGGRQPELVFNYRSGETVLWDNRAWRARHGYRTTYPSQDEDGTVTIDV